ncbi:Flp family type IVb pilin [Zobellella maritima]|uniref:Flp family type IVb pilin n=1 Tax=Zobellella maritima TaxID=2059725 RepID=UPI000E30705E|nr:Flp family type IVb pilin [Zobellella maritima]
MKHFLLQNYIRFQQFLAREDGASAIEYAVIAGLISLAVVVSATTLGDDVSALFGRISTEIKAAVK